MIEYLLAFLRHLEVAIPPPYGKVHAIVAAREQSQEDGLHVDRLAIAVAREIKSRVVYLEHEDLDKPAAQLARECAQLVLDMERADGG
jgi:hypothetical protein